eukprot:TRINITY_DN2524_c0_g6_i1.p1 TRINITY_DN2524_c0_g6~~TRINITY_DN2524_c0_g6_i1.p1  ORF type:complete len:138 (-),score=22.55 TRINITY_DN2524_c0_g6_i1:567-980(-)
MDQEPESKGPFDLIRSRVPLKIAESRFDQELSQPSMEPRGLQHVSTNFTETDLSWYRKAIMILSGFIIAIMLILSQVFWYALECDGSYIRFTCWVIDGAEIAVFASVITIPLTVLGVILAYSSHRAARNSIKYVLKS